MTAFCGFVRHDEAMTILVTDERRNDEWLAALQDELPSATFVLEAELGDPNIEFVVSWRITPLIKSFPNLRAILLTGAGFNHLDLTEMPSIPIVRLIDPKMANDIALYVLSWVIHFQRDFDKYGNANARGEWIPSYPNKFPNEVTVGVLGLGKIGAVIQTKLDSQGFITLGWSRSNHDRPLEEFFAASDIVVNTLPMSAETNQLVDATMLEHLGQGVLINVGRGSTVDEKALDEALQANLRAAVLDVVAAEPLVAESPLWNRPNCIITPHIAGRTNPKTAAIAVVGSIAQLRSGISPDGVIARPA
jgi:glyoxylate/hydroxypyruvate reductase A